MMSSYVLVIVTVFSLAVIRVLWTYAQKMEVRDNELGLVSKHDRLIDVIGKGKHWFIWGNKKITIVDMTKPFFSKYDLNVLLQFPLVRKLLEVIEVRDDQLGLEYKEGLFSGVLLPGRYGYWKSIVEYTIYTYNLNEVEIPASVPRKILAKRELMSFVVKIAVAAESVGVLYIDGEYIRKLSPGVYYFWKTEQQVVVRMADLRAQLLEISGQEILTKDKAAVRINFDVQYKIVDVVRALVDTKDFVRQMYNTIQLALRQYVGTLTLDEILSRKEEVAPFVMAETRSRLAEMGIELLASGMRDIILPGDVKTILNQVLIAQKKAQANNIMRQEETASTRSLLNTAKLMDQNDMLFRLKEMEYVERIAEKVGEITVSGSDKVLSQLTSMWSGSKN